MNENQPLSDEFENTLTPLLRYKPAYAFRTGIFSELDRIFLNPETRNNKNPNLQITSSRPEGSEFHRNYLDSISSGALFEYKTAAAVNSREKLSPGQLIENIGKSISQDVSLLMNDDFHSDAGCYIKGPSGSLFAHKGAKISPMAEINTEDGPVVVDEGASISSFSLLRGPLYIGKHATLDRVFISNSIVGKSCRLGGEISDSLIGNYSNKHHEGFLGHSIVGDWVNLGALTTTSDLKNNYGKIRLQFAGEDHNTGRIKFGSIIGDCVKTGIGSMLNTGTVIDIGSLIFDGFPRQKYFPPFFWGGNSPQRYAIDRFLEDMRVIMGRRQCVPSDFFNNVSRKVFTATA